MLAEAVVHVLVEVVVLFEVADAVVCGLRQLCWLRQLS